MRRAALSQAFLLAAMVAGMRAAEDKAPAPAPAPAAREDSIDAAKRDFGLIKASREGAHQPGTGLPKFTVPEMPSSSPAGAWTPPKPGLPEKKSAQWLVDAMEKKPDPRKGQGRGDDLLAQGAENREFEPKTEKEKLAGRRESDRTDEKSNRREEAVFNPLTRFMADWMTPQDLALMKPVMAARAGGEFSGTTRTGAAVSVSEFALPVAGDSVLGALGANTRPFAPPTPQENPYLQAMASPGPANAPAPLSATPPALPFRVEPRALAPPPSPLPPTSNIPDFAKPLNDEKYFKQLKRF